jgi:hypothetical protein
LSETESSEIVSSETKGVFSEIVISESEMKKDEETQSLKMKLIEDNVLAR